SILFRRILDPLTRPFRLPLLFATRENDVRHVFFSTSSLCHTLIQGEGLEKKKGNMEEQVEQQPPVPPVQQKKKVKNYSCTPRQLEALKKAREAKRFKSQRPSFNPVNPQYHLQEEQVESD